MLRLTTQELAQYRQRIEELDMEARKPGRSLNEISEHELLLLSPQGPIGCQVYASYSDEELLDIFLKALDAPDHKLNYRNIYILYRRYLNQRFGNEATAKNKARTLVKQRKEKAKWPPDWPERVSIEPLLAELKRRNKSVNPEDMRLFIRLCETARQTGLPPTLSKSEQEHIQKLIYCKKAMELMGIPHLNKFALRYMEKYWVSERKKQARVS